MTSVASFDLSGTWITRDGRHITVRRSKRPVAPYIGTLEDGREIYLTVEGNGYENHTEYDLMKRYTPFRGYTE